VLKEIKSDYKIFRKEFSRTIHKKEDLEQVLSVLLSIDGNPDLAVISEQLINSQQKIIIILENLEDFFLRTVNGFEVLNLLFELISVTQSNVFWIATCNLYSWNYLNKVVNIHDYFGFSIILEALNTYQLKEIILRRHNISGYELQFIAPEEVTKQKAYTKLSESAKQDYLQDYYFEKLMKLSSDNVAIALFLWLRSIKEVDDEKIMISADINIDTTFLKSLSDDKLFALVQIIMHDGLSINEHSLINNCSFVKSKLLLSALKDDGIIFNRGEKFKVNFYLYKPVVNILKSKYILH
jgi:tRNA splicing endonuclease